MYLIYSYFLERDIIEARESYTERFLNLDVRGGVHNAKQLYVKRVGRGNDCVKVKDFTKRDGLY